MVRQKSLREYIIELLKMSNKALTIDEIICELERLYSIQKTKRQVRNALYSSEYKEIICVGKDTYDLLSRVVNGGYYRYTLNEGDVEKGMLSCDYELNFLFNPYWMVEEERELTFIQKDKIINKTNIKYLGPDVIPHRIVDGFKEWFVEENLVSGDDVVIKIIDIDNGLYELIPQKKTNREEVIIQKKNKEVADIIVGIISRIYNKSIIPGILIRKLFGLYSYKDPCPPDHIHKIVEKDNRFFIKEIPVWENVKIVFICLKDTYETYELNTEKVKNENTTHTYIFRVKLKHYKSIWREIEIEETMTLDDLANAILDSFQFDHNHLYSFFLSNRLWDRRSEYTSPDAEDEFDDFLNAFEQPNVQRKKADQVKLNKLLLKPKQKFLFLYDYGARWQFEIEFLRENKNADQTVKYPRVIRCKGNPPSQYGL